MRTENFWAAVCSLLLTSLGSASAQSTYRLTNLGTIDGGRTQGKAINSKGKVAGSAFRADGDGTAAVFWNGFRLRDLGTLGGNQSDGVAINSSGMVVGTAQIESAGTHAFLWSKGEMPTSGHWAVTVASLLPSTMRGSSPVVH